MKRRLRIAMIVSGFPTPENPVRGIFNLRSASNLATHVDISIVHLRGWRPGRLPVHRAVVSGLEVVTVSVPQSRRYGGINKAVLRALAFPLLNKFLRGFDILHAVDAAGTGVVAGPWARKLRRHCVVQVIGSDVNLILPRFGGRWGIKGWEKGITAVACNSLRLAESFRTLYPDVHNVTTVYRGVDLDRFSPEGDSQGPFRNRPPVRFLFAGGFPVHDDASGANSKGGLTLLEAWRGAESALAEAGASLLICGPGAQSDRVHAWRNSLRSPGNVAIEGSIGPGDFPSYLLGVDVVLIPSLREGLPNVALEAAAAGRAVIASNVGGLPEVVVEGETGVLLPPGDPSAWRDALTRSAKAPGEFIRMGAAARRRAETSFDSQNYAQQMCALYEAALLVGFGDQ
jgi:glycosyltransferase involved in cell wall biosynthesis